MLYSKLRWLSAAALACCCLTLNLAQDGTPQTAPASAADETALRALVGDFCAAYAKEDLDGFLRLWSAKSPDLAARRKAMEQIFLTYDRIEVKNISPPPAVSSQTPIGRGCVRRTS